MGKKGHTPEKMFYLDKVKNKPSLVIFCDISGSVSVYSAFLLQLVYSMTRCFKDIRTFLYVDEIEEATLAFHEGHAGYGQVRRAPYALFPAGHLQLWPGFENLP